MDITNINALYRISQKKPKEVDIRFPDISEQENHDWSVKYNELLDECGCSSGRQYILNAGPVYIIGLVMMVLFTGLALWFIAVLFGVAVVITGVFGKVKGLLERNKKLNNLTEEFLLKHPEIKGDK